jgi:selenocysteine lyase/cysteine desulfurase
MKKQIEDILSAIKSAGEKADSFFVLMKIGSGRKLLFFDFTLWLIIFWDVYVITSLNLDVFHWSLARTAWNSITLYYISAAALMIIIPPIISALINFAIRDTRLFRESFPSRFRKEALIFHFFTSLAFALYMSISHEFQILSGFKVPNKPSIPINFNDYEYSPLYNSKLLAALTGATVLTLIASYIVEHFTDRANLTEFKLWFNLSDTSTDYFPKQRANLIFVNTASMAPPITWIADREEYYRHTYKKMVPTSDEAKKYLLSAADDCRKLLKEYLFNDVGNAAKFSIEFFPGTSRVLEVGLTQIKNLHTIVLSPYEHPSQYHVVEWHKALHPSVNFTWPPMEYSYLSKGWDDQRSWLIKKIKSAIPEGAQEGRVAILISEVYYLTGMFVDVAEVIRELRPDYDSSNIVFMIDGSQSVGNLLRPLNHLAEAIHGEDFYYFSAHKWLLSPNTCGVSVARQHAERYAVEPYDVFGASLPSATIDPGVIFGTKSSLEYLIGQKMFHLTKFHERSAFLKSYFVEGIKDEFEVIESNSPEMNISNFIAVRPRSGFKWKDETRQDFWSEITRDGVDLTVIPLNGTWWLRISFPYFLQVHLLKQLIKHLKARVRSIN